MIRAALAAAFVALLMCSPALAAHSAAVSCSTKGLSAAGGARVVKVKASRLSCTKALAVARTVASQVIHNRAVSVPGVSGFAMSAESCIGCGRTTTEVTLSYPSGSKVTISIRGAAGDTVTPAPIPAPELPAPGGSGSAPFTV